MYFFIVITFVYFSTLLFVIVEDYTMDHSQAFCFSIYNFKHLSYDKYNYLRSIHLISN
jgi:hypothetical protein